MGDPKKHRKKYSKPRHPWVKNRIVEEVELAKEYGLRRKNEIYKVDSLLRKFKKTAKLLVTLLTQQSEIEKKQLMQRLDNLGILSKEASLDNVLDLTARDILERRLQTIVVRKQLAKTMKQARQFIIHEHIMVDGKAITVPSYIVKRSEENSITFKESSPFFNPEHPERKVEEKHEKMTKKEQKTDETEAPQVLAETEIKEVENEI